MCNYKKDLEHLLNSELPYYLSGDQKTDISQILIQARLEDSCVSEKQNWTEKQSYAS